MVTYNVQSAANTIHSATEGSFLTVSFVRTVYSMWSTLSPCRLPWGQKLTLSSPISLNTGVFHGGTACVCVYDSMCSSFSYHLLSLILLFIFVCCCCCLSLLLLLISFVFVVYSVREVPVLGLHYLTNPYCTSH